MRRLLIALSLTAAFGCGHAPPPAEAPPAGETISGTVLETVDSSQYTYLRLGTDAGPVWTAVPEAGVAIGARVNVVGAMWIDEFKSAALHRTWQRIAFGALDGQVEARKL